MQSEHRVQSMETESVTERIDGYMGLPYLEFNTYTIPHILSCSGEHPRRNSAHNTTSVAPHAWLLIERLVFSQMQTNGSILVSKPLKEHWC
jgi:hypothetical protein